MWHLGLKCNVCTLFKCTHPRIPIFLYTNFSFHLVMNAASDTALVLHVHYTLVWRAISDYCFPHGYAPNTERRWWWVMEVISAWTGTTSSPRTNPLFSSSLESLVWCGMAHGVVFCDPHIRAIFPSYLNFIPQFHMFMLFKLVSAFIACYYIYTGCR